MVLSDDEEFIGKGKTAAVVKETKAAAFCKETKADAVDKGTEAAALAQQKEDGYYKSITNPAKTSNKRLNTHPVAGLNKCPFIEPMIPEYVVLDGSDDSTQNP